jgi:hypothetical protein
MKWAGNAAGMGNTYKWGKHIMFGWETSMKTPLEIPRPRCENKIDTDKKETGWEG